MVGKRSTPFYLSKAVEASSLQAKPASQARNFVNLSSADAIESKG